MKKLMFAAAMSAVAFATPASAEMIEKGSVGDWKLFDHGGTCSMFRNYGNYYHAVSGPFGTGISFGFGSTELTGVSNTGTQPLNVTADAKNWGTVEANGMVANNGLMSGYNFVVEQSTIGKKLPKSVKVVRGAEMIQTIDLTGAGPAYAAMLDCSAKSKP